MKNFLQFIIPILIICGIGLVMLLSSHATDDIKRLYIKCDSISKNYEVYSGSKIFFAEKDEKCKLSIKVINVDKGFIKIETDYLWRLDDAGEIDKTEARLTNIIENDKEVTLISYDEKTKYVFEFK